MAAYDKAISGNPINAPTQSKPSLTYFFPAEEK